ncbi:hypothetical protein [Streptomyces noursei]|uniref:hypothetical protein n=1 Tax=Streptomyces noursei TaxID=1971 RepID=UPI001674148D|nr:hypothetical protein [Streptomyces noursei]MCZ1019385.1 hypothetical protein [Streptomyces noursei]
MVLVEALRVAVPLHMLELSKHTPAEVMAIAQASASVIASKGDVLQFQTPKRGETAKAFNALARGLAAAALTAWGGVTFMGLHWCTECACPGPDARHPEAEDK